MRPTRVVVQLVDLEAEVLVVGWGLRRGVEVDSVGVDVGISHVWGRFGMWIGAEDGGVGC